jgi:hypothetical protein
MDQLKAILTRKFGPAPVWVYALVAVLGLAWYLRSRKPAVTDEAKSENESVLDQYALAYPMNTQGNVTVSVPATTPASGTGFSDPYTQPVFDPAHPYGRSGKLPTGTTLEGLSTLYWGDPKYANLLFLANLDAITKNKGNIVGLDLIVPVNPQYQPTK